MRQIQIQVPRTAVARVLALASEHQAFSPVALEATTQDGDPQAVVLASFANDRIGAFVWAVRDETENARFTLFTAGVIPMDTPLDSIQRSTREVTHLSALELVIASLQSVGSWRGMLLYALFSGLVAAYGVIFDSSFLLVAAMLIAPMGAPAMVSVIGTAVGDWRMVGRGLLRFVASIAVLVLSALLLGFAYGLHISTALMEQVTALSQWGVMVALVAGAAGAQAQAESSRASLVTGTATGFLIAAALSPTSAVLGLSVVLQRWDYAVLMSFQLALQYVAIVTGGWLALLRMGIQPSDPTVERGSGRWRALIASSLVVATVALAVWQSREGPMFRKADMGVQAVQMTRSALRSVSSAGLVEADAHFTRSDLSRYPRETLLVDVVVERRASMPDSTIEAAVRAAISQQIRSRMPGVTPFVGVTVLPSPDSANPGEGP